MEFELDDHNIHVRADIEECANDALNLAYRSAEALKKQFAVKEGCIINIHKVIPVGSGLGGGSSNAATALVALNKMWHLELDVDRLISIASKVGSDVPFFVQGKTALGRNRGETLTPVSIPKKYWGVLVCPNFSVSTSWAYQGLNFSLTNSYKKSKLVAFLQNLEDEKLWRAWLVNDLEPIVFQKHPILSSIKQDCYNLGAFYAQMSGSGSSVYGLFISRAKAKSAVEEFRRTFRTFLFQPVELPDLR
jgi:4-diphosphocytidyl-2-C-methyl-D-erythritol kinase